MQQWAMAGEQLVESRGDTSRCGVKLSDIDGWSGIVCHLADSCFDCLDGEGHIGLVKPGANVC